jgi:hypothetical protein
MTLPRIQKFESLGFEWGVCMTPWEDHLSELADFRKIHGHCNVPICYSENISWGCGSQGKGINTSCRKKERHQL